MDPADRIRLDYEQTAQLIRTLIDIRFKLLLFVPTIAGASVGLLGAGRSAAELLAVGLLGLAASAGIFLYELRNSQVYEAVVERASALEQEIGLGLFRERPSRPLTLFGLVAARHGHGLGLVYGAALAGWTYLVAWGALRALDLGNARTIGAVIGVLVGVLVVAEVERLGRWHGRVREARGKHMLAPSSR
jgi:hypothetical protein